MNTTFTITCANKNVRKKFTNLKEAKSYIKDNNLIPCINYKSIEIVETVVKTHKVNIKIPKLSDEWKIKLFNLGLNNITKEHCRDTFDLRPLCKYDFDRFLEITGITHSDYNLSFNRIDWSSTARNEAWNRIYPVINNCSKLDDYFLEVIKNIDPLKLKYTLVITDYKPCHAICINLTDGVNLLIRSSDIVISRNRVHGRNVHFKSENELIESDILNFKSKYITFINKD